jgi:hypothetical protein
VCGTPTLGWHIAGSVYDFTCDTCARETDASFRRFVRHVVDEVTAENQAERSGP